MKIILNSKGLYSIENAVILLCVRAWYLDEVQVMGLGKMKGNQVQLRSSPNNYQPYDLAKPLSYNLNHNINPCRFYMR